MTSLGLLGVIITLAGEQSDYVDPITFGIATVSILIAIIGISIIFKSPREEKPTKPPTP